MNAKCFIFKKFFRIAACVIPMFPACRIAGQIPDAPNPATQQNMVERAAHGDASDRRPLFSIIPDLGTERVGDQLPPLTVGGKMMIPTRNTLSVLAVVKPAAAGWFKEVTNRDPQLGHNLSDFPGYYWRTALDEVGENYLVEGVFPVLTHQDPRYYAMGEGHFWHRARYSLSRALVIRNDNGRDVFNSSEIMGAASAAGLANLYYPSRQTGLSITAQRFGLNIGFDALTYAAKEFFPDVNRKLFKGKLQPSRE